MVEVFHRVISTITDNGFLRSAHPGNANAQHNLGVTIQENGRGVP